jgi:acetyl esterase/lipase
MQARLLRSAKRHLLAGLPRSIHVSILDRNPPKSDLRLPYGPLPSQFGDLWLPKGDGNAKHRWPLLVFIHGGWWKAEYDLGYAGFLCEAMRSQGIAVWSLEYRRVGDEGGGWPGTMQDVAAGMDHIAKLAEAYPLDLQRVAAAGHSAGGHLAFWLAGRHHIPHESPLREPQPKIALRGVVALAGAVDLRLTIELGGFFSFSNGAPSVRALIGGDPKQVPERYSAADPGRLLPLGVRQLLVQGSNDDQIPAELPRRWAENAKRQGDAVEVNIVPGADHFDVVDPQSRAWAVSRDAMLSLLHT